MKISVTRDDIRGARAHALENPVTRAIRRMTGQTWVVFNGTTAYLRTQPFGSVSLPYEVFQQWQRHYVTGSWQTFDFEFDFVLRREVRVSDRRRRPRRLAPRGGWDRRRQEQRSADRRRGDRRNYSLTARLEAKQRERDAAHGGKTQHLSLIHI